MSAGARNFIVGIDFNRVQPQLCYYEHETNSTVTAPMKIGNEDVSFAGIFDELDTLNRDASLEEEIREEQYDQLGMKTADILRQALATLGLDVPEKQISGISIAVPVLTKPLVKLIRIIYRELALTGVPSYLQDYKESFYYHTLYQKKELWNRNVGFFRFDGKKVSFLSLSFNHMTRPVTVTPVEGVTITLREDKSQWDEQFSNMIQLSLRQNIFSSIFLLGDSFDKAWAERSIPLLCKGGRKVFVVDNIFARGACYAAREKALTPQLGDYLYMGDDLIYNNIGMRMKILGKETYYPLIAAGINWYEADKECECILEGSDDLEFLISDINKRKQTSSIMKLPGLDTASRPKGTTRLKLHLTYDSPKRCVIEVEDLGFGDMFPSSGNVWREVLEG